MKRQCSIGTVHQGRYSSYTRVPVKNSRQYSFRTSLFGKKVLVVSEVFEDWDIPNCVRVRRPYTITKDATDKEAIDVMQQLHFMSSIRIVDAKRKRKTLGEL